MVAHLKHEGKLAALEAQSGVWDLPVASWIKNSRVMYHSWRSRVNERNEAEAEARAKRYERMAASAQKYAGSFDERIAARGERATGSWRVRLDAVQGQLEEVDTQIERLSAIAKDQESRIERARTEMNTLLAATGGDRAARKERFRNLSQEVARQEQLLKVRQKILDGKYRHQRRLVTASDRAKSEIQFFEDRYLPTRDAADEVPTEVPAGEAPAAAPAAPTTTAEAAPDAIAPAPAPAEAAPAPAAETRSPRETVPVTLAGTDRFRDMRDKLEGVTTIRQLAEQFGNLTNNQVERLWNAAFPGAPLEQGHRTLTAMIKAAEPGSTDIDERLDAEGSIKDMFSQLEALYGKSERFREYVGRAVGKDGDAAMQSLISTLSAKIILTTNLNDL